MIFSLLPRHHAVLIMASCLSSCSTQSFPFTTRESPTTANITVFPSTIDQHLPTASLEEFIFALPPYTIHEGSIESFRTQVSHERESQKAKHDEMFCSGDGCWPAKDIKLDRATSTLYILAYPGETGTDYHLFAMRRVRGGWERGMSSDGQDAIAAYRSKGGTVTNPHLKAP